MSTVNFV